MLPPFRVLKNKKTLTTFAGTILLAALTAASARADYGACHLAASLADMSGTTSALKLVGTAGAAAARVADPAAPNYRKVFELFDDQSDPGGIKRLSYLLYLLGLRNPTRIVQGDELMALMTTVLKDLELPEDKWAQLKGVIGQIADITLTRKDRGPDDLGKEILAEIHSKDGKEIRWTADGADLGMDGKVEAVVGKNARMVLRPQRPEEVLKFLEEKKDGKLARLGAKIAGKFGGEDGTLDTKMGAKAIIARWDGSNLPNEIWPLNLKMEDVKFNGEGFGVELQEGVIVPGIELDKTADTMLTGKNPGFFKMKFSKLHLSTGLMVPGE